MLKFTLWTDFSFKVSANYFVILFDTIYHFLKLINDSFIPKNFLILRFLLGHSLVDNWSILHGISTLSGLSLRIKPRLHQLRMRWQVSDIVIFLLAKYCRVNLFLVLLLFINSLFKVFYFFLVFFIFLFLHDQLSNE